MIGPGDGDGSIMTWSCFSEKGTLHMNQDIYGDLEEK